MEYEGDPDATSKDPLMAEHVKVMAQREEALKKVKPTWWWLLLMPILLLDPDTMKPLTRKLKCLKCGKQFATLNGSKVANDHFKGSCPGYNVKVNKQISLNQSGGGSSGNGSSTMSTAVQEGADAFKLLLQSKKKQTAIDEFTLPANLTQKIRHLLCLLIYEGFGKRLGFSFVENPRLLEILHLLGMKPLTRKWVANTQLNKVYTDKRAVMEKQLGQSEHFQVANGTCVSPQSK